MTIMNARMMDTTADWLDSISCLSFIVVSAGGWLWFYGNTASYFL
jgi:hypothetical protein